MNDVAKQIKQFNAGRDPERLALKLGKMRADPFIFLRGSCHLFYARLPREPLFTTAPPASLPEKDAPTAGARSSFRPVHGYNSGTLPNRHNRP